MTSLNEKGPDDYSKVCEIPQKSCGLEISMSAGAGSDGDEALRRDGFAFSCMTVWAPNKRVEQFQFFG